MSKSEHTCGLWSQFTAVSSRVSRADVLAYVLILCLGASQWFFIPREKDFPDDQVFWVDAGRALVEHGFYGINGNRETNMPPGLPAIIGVFDKYLGDSPSIIRHAMVVFGSLALLACYELLRRQAPRIVAAAICLLLVSSLTYFFATRTIYPPGNLYMLTTLSALLVAGNLEKAQSLVFRIAWGALMTVLVVVSVALASAGIALLGAIVARIVSTFIWTRRLALTRLWFYLPVLVVGLAVQGLWTHHEGVDASGGTSASEWPLPGFPHSYLSQLMVKNGNHPELGLAGPLDFAARITDNIQEHCELLSRILLRTLPPLGWTAIFTILPLLFVALGWCDSLWRSKGGLQEWYFAGYESIQFLWPWHMGPRGFLPIAPLACLYMWRGGKTFLVFVRRNPRIIGGASLPVTIILAVGAWFQIHGPPMANQHRFFELQNELSFICWVLLTLLSLWMLMANGHFWKQFSVPMRIGSASLCAMPIDLRRLAQGGSITLVACIILVGIIMQLKIGLGNLNFGYAENSSPDAAAGAWIRIHTGKDVVIMARHVPTVSHYSNRKVIWFPPASDANFLMEGIARHKIDFVIVVHRESSFYLPPDDECFAKLLATYSDAFHLEFEAPEFRIFRVTSNSHRSSQYSASAVH